MSFFSKLFSKKSPTKFPNVVVAKILSVEPHPNADRLRVASVDNGKTTLQIVCGAPNIAADQLVPLAEIGAVLPNGTVITKASLRGVESFGMLCAADELGLGNDHSGIMVLSAGKPGDAIDAFI